MSREQRTRLNAELAYQYGRAGAPTAAPGRSSRTGELDEQQELPDEHEAAPAEHAEHAGNEPGPASAESKRSLFDLPRKDPARPPLVPGGSTADAGDPTES